MKGSITVSIKTVQDHYQVTEPVSIYYVSCCVFIGCEYETHGGAIFSDENKAHYITSCIFIKCVSRQEHGGAIMIHKGNVFIYKCCTDSCSSKGGDVQIWPDVSSFKYHYIQTFHLKAKVHGTFLDAPIQDIYSINISSNIVDDLDYSEYYGKALSISKTQTFVNSNLYVNAFNCTGFKGIIQFESINGISITLNYINCQLNNDDNGLITLQAVQNTNIIINHSNFLENDATTYFCPRSECTNNRLTFKYFNMSLENQISSIISFESCKFEENVNKLNQFETLYECNIVNFIESKQCKQLSLPWSSLLFISCMINNSI